MNAQEVIAKADRGEGLTEEEIKIYRAAVKPQKHLYGKYGSLAKKYLEEHNVGKFWAIENLPEYLNFLEDYRRQTEIRQIIESEILSELVYVD